MTYCGEDWLRGARHRKDLEYLFSNEILEEFDDMRMWLFLLRNVILHEVKVTGVYETLQNLWKLHDEVVRSWGQTSRLFLSGDHSTSVRDCLISIYNAVTTAADNYSLSQLLPPPIFKNGELVRPSLSSKTTLVRKIIKKTCNAKPTTAMKERRRVQKQSPERTTHDRSILNTLHQNVIETEERLQVHVEHDLETVYEQLNSERKLTNGLKHFEEPVDSHDHSEEKRILNTSSRSKTAPGDEHTSQAPEEQGTRGLATDFEKMERCKDNSYKLPTVHESVGEACVYCHDKKSLLRADSEETTNNTCGKSRICSLQ
ncbi:uncharacterized protein LOC124151767 [Haliotis rufescens]|uniref:uncharacterized protein LOC124151767 n=1 Tax=Haliotis rufescens TaxID=6454 RepID=UPI00201FA02D|nr:uncharacterized protein LOC124151767 [Haliotis rufescens]